MAIALAEVAVSEVADLSEAAAHLEEAVVLAAEVPRLGVGEAPVEAVEPLVGPTVQQDLHSADRDQ